MSWPDMLLKINEAQKEPFGLSNVITSPHPPGVLCQLTHVLEGLHTPAGTPAPLPTDLLPGPLPNSRLTAVWEAQRDIHGFRKQLRKILIFIMS